MADAEDLKSSGDFSSCGFDSHPGHCLFLFVSSQQTGFRSPRTSWVPFISQRKIAFRTNACSLSASDFC